MISESDLLYIEPWRDAAASPLIDELTCKMTAAYRAAQPDPNASRGFHECVCGAQSTCCDYFLPDGQKTNSLCIHYLAHHREEIPPAQLERVASLHYGKAEPTGDELQGPELLQAEVRARVQHRLGPDRLNTWIRWGLDVESLSRSLRVLCVAQRRARDLLTLLVSIQPSS